MVPGDDSSEHYLAGWLQDVELNTQGHYDNWRAGTNEYLDITTSRSYCFNMTRSDSLQFITSAVFNSRKKIGSFHGHTGNNSCPLPGAAGFNSHTYLKHGHNPEADIKNIPAMLERKPEVCC